MCKYRNESICTITNSNCPWAFWCGNIAGYKERESCNKYCKLLKIEEEKNIPDGYLKVQFERHGYLYVDIDHQTIKIKNILDYIPDYIKIRKVKSSYKMVK